MSAVSAVHAPVVVRGRPTLLALARVEARRFALHPLFLFGAASVAVLDVVQLIQRSGGGGSPIDKVVMIAFLVGVFGFVVAHRLTTSMRRTADLAGTAPLGRQQRTAALCLACLVPFAAGCVATAFMLVTQIVWPPTGIPASAHVASFRDEPDLALLTAVLAMASVATLGGPLLGVAVARWAPFRGSALVGVVTLLFLCSAAGDISRPWNLLAPWPILYDEKTAGNSQRMATSWLLPHISPPWVLGYTLCLCGLAVVAALLRDRAHRRQLLWAGGVLTVCAVACFAMAGT